MEVKNSLTKKTERKVQFSDFMNKPIIKEKIRQVVSGERGNRFITAIIAAVATNPAIAECDSGSILASALEGEALQLSPSPKLGQFYMLPFGKKQKVNGEWIEGIKKAQFVLGYKGYIQLAIRSGQYRKINVISLKAGELISFNPLTEEMKVDLIEDEEVRESTETTHYYARFEYFNGFEKALCWTKKKMELHADQYVPYFDLSIYKKIQAGERIDNAWKYSGFWYKNFDAQGLKTMIRQLISKWGIMSIEMQRAYEKDNESMKNVDSENNIQDIDIPKTENLDIDNL